MVKEGGCSCFSKCFFMSKYFKMIFFYFIKIIFEISVSKQSKIYKKINFSQKKIEFIRNTGWPYVVPSSKNWNTQCYKIWSICGLLRKERARIIAWWSTMSEKIEVLSAISYLIFIYLFSLFSFKVGWSISINSEAIQPSIFLNSKWQKNLHQKLILAVLKQLSKSS